MRERYVNLALMGFNTAVLFIVVNLVIGFGCNLKDGPLPTPAEVPPPPVSTEGRPRPGPHRSSWQMDHIDMAAFEGVQQPDVEAMLDDMARFADLGVVYQPWVEYGPPAYQGAQVNVEGPEPEFLYRRSVPPSVKGDGEPLDVYLFGGSTTFGWDTADSWTVGSYLWDALQRKFPHRRVKLVNYGRPLYYSSQEVVLFQRLLKTGHHPSVALFLDGLNDVYQLSYRRDQPWMTPRLTELLHRDQIGRTNDLEAYQWIPIVKLAFYLRHRLSHQPINASPVAMDSSDAPAAEVADYVLHVYRANRAMARAAGIPCYFFWQPSPFYAYDLALHRVPPPMSERNRAVYRIVYEAMAHDPESIDLGSLAQSYGHRKIYVDDVHYSPAFARFIAERMAAAVHRVLTPREPAVTAP